MKDCINYWNAYRSRVGMRISCQILLSNVSWNLWFLKIEIMEQQQNSRLYIPRLLEDISVKLIYPPKMNWFILIGRSKIMTKKKKSETVVTRLVWWQKHMTMTREIVLAAVAISTTMHYNLHLLNFCCSPQNDNF